MKSINLICMLGLTASAANGGGLYQVPTEDESSIPLQWSVGMDMIWDDNTTPGGSNDGDETLSLNPYTNLTYASVTPRTTISLYSRLGLVYYFDQPIGDDSKDIYAQSRVGFDLSRQISERLRFTSKNYLAYELEPDYSFGVGTNRQSGEYLLWSSDNSIGFRWSERLATYTGFTIEGLGYETVENSNRITSTAYNQFRYQVNKKTVLTASYRHAAVDADGGSDTSNKYILGGLEHRPSANTTFVMNAGAQLRSVEGSDTKSTNPYIEFSTRTQVNKDWGFRSFIRYGSEDYDTVVSAPDLSEFQNKITLRVGVSGDYKLSSRLAIFGGVNVISSSFQDGKLVSGGDNVSDKSETLINAYIGPSIKLNDNLFGTLTYNITSSSSDVVDRDYDRNKISAGLRAEF